MAKKKETKNQQNPFSQTKRYAHVDEFVKTAKSYFQLSQGEVEGFKVFMVGKSYQYNEKDFIPYLEEYLGKKLV